MLLAFFIAPREVAETVLVRYLEIASFDSALFVLKRPWWRGTGKPSRLQLKEGDPRFWYARGAFKPLLDRLWRNALAPIRATENVPRDVRRRPEPTERQFLFLKDLEALSSLRESGDDAKTLFGYLESLFLCDLMDEVRVVVKRSDGGRVKFVQMSEGEQQLLTVLGLMLFTRNDESLYLLDEPDTHLNPIWTYEYLGLLQESIRADKGHLLVATHNPLMIGGLVREQVRKFSRVAGETFADEPDYDPIGVSLEGLLKSELYGLRSTLAPEILELLDEQYTLLGLESPSSDERERLRKVSSDLNRLAVVHTFPNPYFDSFASALARRQNRQAVAATPEDIEAQARLADEILRELATEDENGPLLERDER